MISIVWGLLNMFFGVVFNNTSLFFLGVLLIANNKYHWA